MKSNESPKGARKASARPNGLARGEQALKVKKNLHLDDEIVGIAEKLMERQGLKTLSQLVQFLIKKAATHGVPGEPPLAVGVK